MILNRTAETEAVPQLVQLVAAAAGAGARLPAGQPHPLLPLSRLPDQVDQMVSKDFVMGT
jgi:hypothetical protein